jgi:hypothetical protein
MNTYILIDENNVVVGEGTSADADGPAQVPGLRAVVDVFGTVGEDYYDNALKICKPLPAKPSGEFVFDYPSLSWVPDPTAQWALVRDQRNRLLQESDWTQMPDVHIDTKDTWAQYRQELRDVTDQPDPFNIIWPTPPQ